MRSNDSKRTTYTQIKKYAFIFTVIFIGAILFFVEHFLEAPISITDVQPGEIYNQKSQAQAIWRQILAYGIYKGTMKI